MGFSFPINEGAKPKPTVLWASGGVSNSLQGRSLGIDVADEKEWVDVTESSTHKCQVTLNDLCPQLKGKIDKSLVEPAKVNARD